MDYKEKGNTGSEKAIGQGARIGLTIALYGCMALYGTRASAQDQDTIRGMQPSDLVIEEVQVQGRRASTVKSRTSAFDTQTLNAGELCKAACCNLSESFETNASVDVSYSDAATGAKQIRLLGLAGTYVQLLTENTPGIRGLAQQFGMEYIPGPWMQSIQISKGTSSVINGYEATTGQINVEYLKPETSDPLAINIMANTEAHTEVNLTGGWCVKEPTEAGGADISTALLAHGQYAPLRMDMNGDGFMDMPTGGQGNLLNRWDISKGNYTGRILVRGLYDLRQGGQSTHMHDQAGHTLHSTGDELYKIDLRTWRVEGFMKNGVVIDAERGMSVGIITAVSHHNQQNMYGHRIWDAHQTNAYLNGIFATNFGEAHKLSAGLSVNHDHYGENFAIAEAGQDLSRDETTAGVWAEYSFQYDERLSVLAGIRADWSSHYGAFATPRMNIRYSPWEWWNIRASAGLGYRSPNLLADNAFVLPSSRELRFKDEKGNMGSLQDAQRQVKQERALNAGISTTFYIPIGSKELQLSGEYYYTHFFEALVTDLDTDPHAMIFSNLNGGKSFAQTAQAEATMEILRGWTMTAAFRYTDVRQTINGELRERPLTPKYKGLITTSYQTPLKKWQFDLTAQFNGGGRLPDPDKENPLWEKQYNWYPQLLAQITKYWRTCSLYVGGENLTNYMQENPIIGADKPFEPDFDASMVYAPISGWKLYIGFRWNLERKED